MFGVDRPVQLGRIVVAPALVEPEFGIGIEFFILIEALDARGKAWLPDPKGTDSEFHVRLGRFDLLIETLDELIHLIATPVVARKLTSGFDVVVPSSIVGEGCIVDGVGVEVIVDMNAVDVIALDHIEEYL